MKLTKLYCALLSLSFSLNVFALGLGELSVHSNLDQPFDAEIVLNDVGDTPLTGIKATLASVEEYQRVGLERAFVLGDLTFTVEQNQQGRPIIKVHSRKLISDPFIQLLVDLAWSKGQLYREYTVLLDPPQYDLAVTQQSGFRPHKHHRTEPGVVDREVYESVGPSHAWHTKQSITPNGSLPSATEREGVYESQLPVIPTLIRTEYAIPSVHTFGSAEQDVSLSVRPIISTHLEENPALKAQMDVAVSAIDSVRESNALLKEQLKQMQAQNKLLQEQFNQHNSEVKALHDQIELLMRRQGMGGQVMPSSEPVHHHLWLWILLLLGAGGAYIGWRLWRDMDNLDSQPFIQPSPHLGDVTTEETMNTASIDEQDTPAPVANDSVLLNQEEGLSAATRDEPIVEIERPEPLIVAEAVVNDSISLTHDEKPSPYLGDLANIKPMETSSIIETGKIEPVVVTELLLDEPIASSSTPLVPEDVRPIDFAPAPTEDLPLSNPKQEKPVRSKAALETMIALAETYIEMGDIASATESLQEVIEYGNKKQQESAKAILSRLKLL